MSILLLIYTGKEVRKMINIETNISQSDIDYADPKFNNLMQSVKPWVRKYFASIINEQGYEKGVRTINKALVNILNSYGVKEFSRMLLK